MTNCPLCGDLSAGSIENCHDLVLGIPGTWRYRRCSGCASLWIEPWPRSEEIPSFYPREYYIHGASDPLELATHSKLGRLKLWLKLALFEKQWGYSVPAEWWKRVGGNGWEPLAGFRSLASLAAGKMVRFLPHRQGGRLLDIGCGKGNFLLRMRELGWDVEGIEPGERAASMAREQGLSVFKGSVEDAELVPESYDAITMSHVIEHLLDPAAVVRRCINALRPGGTFVSLSPNPEGTNARLFQATWRGLEPPRHLILPSLSGYRALLDGLPVRANLSTIPVQMGLFWLWSRRNAGKNRFGRLENLWAMGMDLVGGPLLVRWRPEAGEECVCVARKTQVPSDQQEA